jgi:hypothetical protein
LGDKIGRDAASRYRLEYLQGDIKTAEAKKIEITSWSTEDIQNMKYRTIGRIFEDLGGRTDPSVLEGLMAGIAMCTAMGHPWVHKHPQTGLIEFVIVEFSWAERFKRSWDSYKKENLGDKAIADVSASPSPSGSAIEERKDDKKDKKDDKKDKKDNKKDEKDDKKGKKDDKKGKDDTIEKDDKKDKRAVKKRRGAESYIDDYKEALKEAKAVKTLFTQVKGSAVDLHNLIKQDPAYTRFKGVTEDELIAKIETVASAMTGKLQDFVLRQEAVLKKTGFYDDDESTLVTLFNRLIALKPAIVSLESLCAAIQQSQHDLERTK